MEEFGSSGPEPDSGRPLPHPRAPLPQPQPQGQPPQHRARKGPPLQIRLRTLFLLSTVLAIVFSTLNGVGVPAEASLLVLIVLAGSVVAGLGLVIVIAGSMGDREREPGGWPERKPEGQPKEPNGPQRRPQYPNEPEDWPGED